MNPLFASAVKSMQAGQFAEAERLCNAILAVTPGDVPAIHLLGFVAYKSGRLERAIELIERAIALEEDNPDCHFNLGLALLAAGRLPDAANHFDRATALKPDYTVAVSQLVNAAYDQANRALEQGRLGEAVAFYRQALALNPNFAEASSNLGVALMAQGHAVEAAAAYRSALAANPNLLATYRNLGRALIAQGKAMEAVALARCALDIAQPDDIKAFFVQCVRSLPPGSAPGPALEGIEPLLARALTEGWGRAEVLIGLATDLIGRRGPSTDNALLLAHLESAPVRDVALERWLTQQRRRLLLDGHDDSLDFACALACQCFINEYLFIQDEEEIRRAAQLRDAVAAGTMLTPLQLAVLAATMPLHTLPNAEMLLNAPWPAPLIALLDRQLRQPLEERDDRAKVLVLTAIEDEVSRAVREQYEEMPYPRWLKAALVEPPVPVEQYLRGQFRLAPLRPLGRTGRLDVLVAGCGTGQHPIETARRYTGAQVLAVDLSLGSLCYGRRMARALGVSNIEFAQADILKLGAIGRSFDVIESVGVLHHLADPQAGWRVLLSLLRPNGLMLIGLYSRLARREIVMARDFAAQRGYGRTADDIRRCRQELLALPDDNPLKTVTRFGDFYTTSNCRDLLFHVHEHQFSIPDIKAFLAQSSLTLIGFATDPAIAQQYRARFPHDAAMTDLDCWSELEADNPYIFASMYQFWVQK